MYKSHDNIWQDARTLAQNLGLVMGILLYVHSLLATALPEDKLSILHIRAGYAKLSQLTHRGTYLKGIALDQGSTHIRAASAITETNTSNQLTKAVIAGNRHHQAHYWALTAPNKPLLHAYADTMIYHPLTQEIELLGHARVQQGKHAFTAAQIRYDLKTQHVLTQSTPGEQTTLIIQAEKST